MTIQVTTVFYILMVHFLADFGLQTHDQAVQKSSSNKWLFYHVGVYSLVWLVASYCFLESFVLSILFATVTFLAHFTTDYVTSRVGKPFWENKDMHNGFVVVGADQVAHYIQLILTYEWIVTLN